MTALRRRMLEDLRIRNYAPATVRCYVRSIAEFAQHFDKPPDQLGADEIREYQLFLLNEKRVNLSSYIQAICALASPAAPLRGLGRHNGSRPNCRNWLARSCRNDYR